LSSSATLLTKHPASTHRMVVKSALVQSGSSGQTPVTCTFRVPSILSVLRAVSEMTVSRLDVVGSSRLTVGHVYEGVGGWGWAWRQPTAAPATTPRMMNTAVNRPTIRAGMRASPWPMLRSPRDSSAGGSGHRTDVGSGRQAVQAYSFEYTVRRGQLHPSSQDL